MANTNKRLVEEPIDRPEFKPGEEKVPEVSPPPQDKQPTKIATPQKPKYSFLVQEYQEEGSKSIIRFANEGFASDFELFGWLKERLPNAEAIIQLMKQSGSG